MLCMIVFRYIFSYMGIDRERTGKDWATWTKFTIRIALAMIKENWLMLPQGGKPSLVAWQQ